MDSARVRRGARRAHRLRVFWLVVFRNTLEQTILLVQCVENLMDYGGVRGCLVSKNLIRMQTDPFPEAG